MNPAGLVMYGSKSRAHHYHTTGRGGPLSGLNQAMSAAMATYGKVVKGKRLFFESSLVVRMPLN